MTKTLDNAGKEFALYHLKKGKTIEDVTVLLTENGYAYQEAFTYVNQLVVTSNQEAATTDKKNATVNIILGILILVIGVTVTFASSGGVIAYGAILVGIVKFFKGLAASNQN
jgi:hypothetical protein